MSDERYELNKPQSFQLHLDDELLDQTRQKLKLARFPAQLGDLAEDDWSSGASLASVRSLAEYWLNEYDWRRAEETINAHFKQYKVKINIPDIGEHVMHFVHHPSQSPNAIPLLFAAGWPGSFLEAKDIIGPLASPPEQSTQAFHVVVVSIPGFGPGEPTPVSTFSTADAAKAFKIVMVDVLGYEKFVTQGGDFGSWITRIMALEYPQHVRACHTNFLVVKPPPFYWHPFIWGRLVLSPLLYQKYEKEAVKRMQDFFKKEAGYIAIQSTKPQSLGFALGDSPVGLLAWFVEKFHQWIDEDHFTMPKNDILTWVMMHWMWGATPGLRFYKAVFDNNNALAPYETWCDTPYGYSEFPDETATPPLDWIRPTVNLKWHRRHEKGGHFASTEQPELLVQDLREWFGSDVVAKRLL